MQVHGIGRCLRQEILLKVFAEALRCEQVRGAGACSFWLCQSLVGVSWQVCFSLQSSLTFEA